MDEISEMHDDFVVSVRSGDVHAVTSIRRSLDSWLVGCHVPPERAADVLLACYEAMANVVEHAYRAGQERGLLVHASRYDCGLSVTIIDHGSWQVRTSERPNRTRGLRLMTELSDKADIHTGDGGTSVELAWDLVGGRSG